MTYKPGYLRERSKEIINARNWGIGIITALLGLGLLVSEIQRIRTLQFDIMQYAYLTVFMLTGILIFLWIWSTQKELDLLFEWLDPERYAPPSTIKETFLILFFALILTGMLLASRNPVWYGAIFTTYSSVLIPSIIYTNKEIARAILNSKQRVERDLGDETLVVKANLYLQGIGILESYFLKRPIVKRLVCILLASLLATGFAVWWHLYGSTTTGTISYALFATIIIVSEILIGYWRCVRDGCLRTILAELAEYQREEAEGESHNKVSEDMARKMY